MFSFYVHTRFANYYSISLSVIENMRFLSRHFYIQLTLKEDEVFYVSSV